MAEEELSDEPVDIVVKTPDGTVEYKITRRSGTQFICEVNNELPDSYNDTDVADKFLTCVDPEKNAYKFYKLSVIGNSVKASYGRMGVSKGELFGERSFMYPLSMFWIKYYEKIGKGYVDRTELYLDKEPVKKQAKQSEKKTLSQKQNSPSSELFGKLRSFAKNAVKKANVKVPITQAIINKSKELLDAMRTAKTTEEFNKHLMDLVSILQRPVRTGDGRGVKDLMADSSSDFARIINRESDLVAAMEGVKSGGVAEAGDFNDYDIEVYEATEKQKAEVLRHLSDLLKSKVKNVYRVIPKQQKERFDSYLEKNNIKSVRQLWHGSRNENWMSIIQNSLQLNPNAVITGKMFGHGICVKCSSINYA